MFPEKHWARGPRKPTCHEKSLRSLTLSEQSAKTKKIRRVGWFQISGHAMDRHGSMVPAIASDRLKRALDFEVSSEALGQHPVKEFAERHLQCFLWCCRQLALKLPIHNRCIAYKDTHTHVYIYNVDNFKYLNVDKFKYLNISQCNTMHQWSSMYELQ